MGNNHQQGLVKLLYHIPHTLLLQQMANSSLSGRTNYLNRTLINRWTNNYGNCGKSSCIHTPSMKFLTLWFANT